MMKHVIIFLAALLVIASSEVAADDKNTEPVKAELIKKDAGKEADVEENDEEEFDVAIPKEVAQMIADEMETMDEDELEDMEDVKIPKKMKDAWGVRRWVSRTAHKLTRGFRSTAGNWVYGKWVAGANKLIRRRRSSRRRR